MSARAWQKAENARTLQEAHDALVALRPLPEASRATWVTYHQRSSAVYRQVAEVDRGHQGHAMYWAEREKAKADRLIGPGAEATDPSAQRRPRRGKARDATGYGARMPSSLEEAHEALSKMRPRAPAGPAEWAAYRQHAAAVYAEMAEVDRAHHHEALFYASAARRNAALGT